jgi:hypothetical protein
MGETNHRRTGYESTALVLTRAYLRRVAATMSTRRSPRSEPMRWRLALRRGRASHPAVGDKQVAADVTAFPAPREYVAPEDDHRTASPLRERDSTLRKTTPRLAFHLRRGRTLLAAERTPTRIETWVTPWSAPVQLSGIGVYQASTPEHNPG